MRPCIRCLIASLGLLSSIASATDLEVSKIRCSEAGANFAAKFKSQHDTDVSVWGNPEFHYSVPLSTCLVYTEVIDGSLHKEINALWYYRRITDVYSNKVLAYSRYLVKKDDPTKKETLVNLMNVGGATNLIRTEFDVTKADLFKP